MSTIQAIGLKGVHEGLQRATEDATRVTEAFEPNSTTEPVEPMVALAQDKRQVEASAKVIKVGNNLDRTILDLMA